MVMLHGLKLASNLISAHFGVLVAKVCDCLLRKGSLTLPEVSRYTELPTKQVKNCLLVLIQHNCVQAFTTEKDVGFGVAPKVVTLYTTIFENIIHRIRFSKFLAIVSEEHNNEGKEIFEGLLQHGRLTLEQIISRAKSKPSKSSEGKSISENDIRASFVKLVSAHFVERCPASEPFLAASEEETPSTAKRGPKSAKLAVTVQTIEKRAIAAAICSDGERFAIPLDIGTDVTVEAQTKENPSKGVGEKRKLEELELDRENMAAVCEKEVLWRANFEEFVGRLRYKACVANVRSQLDGGAEIVFKAMLDATRRADRKVKIEKSVPMSLDAISEEVMNSNEGRSMMLPDVRAALAQLGCDTTTRELDESYSVDLKNIIDIARSNEVESIVLKRYGMDAYRIYRLLSKTGNLTETDKISGTTFVDKKDALKILYTMWKDDYVFMEKLTFAGAQSQLLLWKVNRDTLWKLVLDEMHHAAINLSERVAHELTQEQEIIQLPSHKRVGVAGKRFERIRKVKVLLESSLMKLDDAIMLFHDF